MTMNREYYKYYLKIVSQNAPDSISAHIHFKTFPTGGGGMPQTPLGSSLPSPEVPLPKREILSEKNLCDTCQIVLDEVPF